MGGKKPMIVMAVFGVVAFAAAFGATKWLGGKGPAEEEAGAKGQATGPSLQEKLESLTPKERQLDEMIREVRQQAEEMHRRGRLLDEREKRFRIAQARLEKTAAELDKLPVQLAVTLNQLKDLKGRIDQSRILITTEEVANLQRVAKWFEKMDSEKGAQMLTVMCRNERTDDAVKILRFMTDKVATRILESITDTDDKLGAALINETKRVRKAG